MLMMAHALHLLLKDVLTNILECEEIASLDDGSCETIVVWMSEWFLFEYNPETNLDDGSCNTIVYGCMDLEAFNFVENATVADDSCVERFLDVLIVIVLSLIL